MEITLNELAKKLGFEYQGDGNCIIRGVGTIQSAKSDQITFLDNLKYKKYLATTSAGVVILNQQYESLCKSNLIFSSNPQLSYAKVAALFFNPPVAPVGIHPTAIIGNHSQIDPSASIGPYCVIGDNVTIGKHTIIGAHTTIGENSKVGNYCRLWARISIYYGVSIGDYVEIHSGAVIGADGFGIAKSAIGWEKVSQLGGVVISDHVEIGANTCIDRGAIENTIIGEGVKLDNQIQIGHNVQIDTHTVVAGCSGIAGSTKIGKNCLIGGAVGIVGHIEIADNVMIAAMAGISKSLTEPGIYAGGIQADKLDSWRKNAASFRHLSDMAEKIRDLEKLVGNKKTSIPAGIVNEE